MRKIFSGNFLSVFAQTRNSWTRDYHYYLRFVSLLSHATFILTQNALNAILYCVRKKSRQETLTIYSNSYAVKRKKTANASFVFDLQVHEFLFFFHRGKLCGAFAPQLWALFETFSLLLSILLAQSCSFHSYLYHYGFASTRVSKSRKNPAMTFQKYREGVQFIEKPDFDLFEFPDLQNDSIFSIDRKHVSFGIFSDKKHVFFWILKKKIIFSIQIILCFKITINSSNFFQTNNKSELIKPENSSKWISRFLHIKQFFSTRFGRI